MQTHKFTFENRTPHYQDLIEAYWNYNVEKEAFTHTTSALARKFGMEKAMMLETILRISRAYSDKITCDYCNSKIAMKSRDDFKMLRKFSLDPQKCYKCSQKDPAKLKKKVVKVRQVEKSETYMQMTITAVLNNDFSMWTETYHNSLDDYVQKLNYEQAVMLNTCLKFISSTSGEYLLPSSRDLKRSDFLLSKALEELLTSGFIIPSKRHLPKSVQNMASDSIKSYHLAWEIPVYFSDDPASLIKLLKESIREFFFL